MSSKFNPQSLSLESISTALAITFGIDSTSSLNSETLLSQVDNDFSLTPSSNLKSDFAAYSKGAVALSQYLSYRYYDEDSNLFFDDEGNSGFFMELSPIVGSDVAILKNLNHFFNDEMPDNSFMQFLLLASNDISNIINHWQKSRISDSLPLKMLGAKRREFLENLSSDFKISSGRHVRDYKLYVVFTSKTNQTLSKLANQLASSPKNIRDSKTYPEIAKLKNFMQILTQKLDSINLAPKLLIASDLIKLVREILELELVPASCAPSNLASTLSPKSHSKPSLKYDLRRILADQILTPLTSYEVLDDRVINHSKSIATKSYYVSELPDSFSLNQIMITNDDDSLG
jgi:hypothetical protein